MILGEPIILGGGGGIACVVIITTDPSAVVTCSLGNTSISKTANADGKAVFELKKAGVWTITASLNGETVSKEIDTSLALETELTFADPILENNTWEQISKIARSGKASTIWNVGDTKTFMFQTKVCHAQIIGFDHDDVSDPTSYGREKAGITFQLVELPANEIYMNSSMDTETNSYINSLVRSTLVSYFNSYIDSTAKNYIVKVNKDYEPSRKTTAISQENLFLLSEAEYTGTKSLGANILGTQYPYWAAGNSRIKYKVSTGTAYSHWTRNRGTESEEDFVYIKTDGTFRQYGSHSSTNCCPFAFCL